MGSRLSRSSEIRASFEGVINRLYDATFFTDRDAPRRLEATLLAEQLGDATIILCRGWVWKQRGSNLLAAGDLDGARANYKRALRAFLGIAVDDETFVLPSLTAVNIPASQAETNNFVEAAMCANNIAQCYIKEGNHSEVNKTMRILCGMLTITSYFKALDWLQEVHDIYLSFANPKKAPAVGKLVITPSDTAIF